MSSFFSFFLRYVVRAKAGGRQSTRDSTGQAPKSAGSSLRRHNEAALEKVKFNFKSKSPLTLAFLVDH